jgi:gas vesicle protein
VKKRAKLWRNMMIGAAVGTLISLLDRETRKSLHVKTIWQQRAECVRQLQQRVRQYRQSIETLTEDVIFIAEKIKEIAEKTPEVMEFLKESYNWKKDDSPQMKK